MRKSIDDRRKLMKLTDTTIHTCELVFEFGSEEEAALVARSVSIDNPEFISLELEGKILRSRIEAPTLPSMINSLDDYLACLALAEKLAGE